MKRGLGSWLPCLRMSQLNRRLLFIGGILAAVAIIAVITNNRHDLDQANGERQPSCTPSEISNSKSQISNPATGWRGCPR